MVLVHQLGRGLDTRKSGGCYGRGTTVSFSHISAMHYNMGQRPGRDRPDVLGCRNGEQTSICSTVCWRVYRSAWLLVGYLYYHRIDFVYWMM